MTYEYGSYRSLSYTKAKAITTTKKLFLKENKVKHIKMSPASVFLKNTSKKSKMFPVEKKQCGEAESSKFKNSDSCFPSVFHNIFKSTI